MQRKKIAAISRLNGYAAEKGLRRAPVYEVNGYASEKSRLNSQFVHLFILFTGERTSNHGIFMPYWDLEDPSESERVWGGLRSHVSIESPRDTLDWPDGSHLAYHLRTIVGRYH